MELRPETILKERYRIIHPLGQGGMGAVYLAYDANLEQEVAVKSNRNPAEESTTQFLREAQLLASLRHPHLPRVIDYFILDQNQYLVMDYIPGDDLENLLKKQGVQPLDQVMRWAQQIGGALSYLHSQNPPVIHRDIKPANIKLTPGNEAILVDFGIAKSGDLSQATATGAVGYTPGYAPPEQYGGARTSPASDQYAFAATLYTLLSGQRPVDSIQRVLSEAVLTPLKLLTPALPAHICEAIERAMSVRPEDRFISIDEFLHTLIDPSFQPTLRPTVKAQPAAPTAPGRKRFSTGFLLAIGAAAILLLVFGVSAAGYYFGFGKRAIASPTAMPLAQAITASQETIESPEPPATATTAPSHTPEPTLTPEPTQQPSPTPQMLGQGGRIAFSSDRAGGETLQIWTMKVLLDNSGNITPGELAQLTFDAGDKIQPAWSPDGARLLYVAPDSDDQNGKDIWLLDLNENESQPVNLTRRKGDDTDPSWSPDGKMIAFTNHRFDGVRQVYLMEVDGSNPQRVSFDFDEYSPLWSPNMKWLMNVVYASSHNYLYLRGWEGTVIYPTPYPTPQGFDRASIFGRLGEVDHPAWSPDGSQIAYTRVEGASQRIYSVITQSRGGSISLLTKDTNRDREPAWSPDAEWIVFTSERDGNPEIFIMTSAGLLQTNLTNHPGRDQHPAWGP